MTTASSPPARPIKRLAHPSTLALEILPRQNRLNLNDKRYPSHSTTLHHTDSFRLTITAFDELYYLHLRPNDHLIHPSAHINYYTTGPDGQNVLSHSEPLLRESVKAYWGEVISVHHSPSRMREDAAGVLPRPSGQKELGWARIMVHHQGNVVQGIAPSFEGAFSVNGVVHHVMTKENYLRNKLDLDPELVSPLGDLETPLVIWRDSDIMSTHEEKIARFGGFNDSTLDPAYTSSGPQTCGHDHLDHNIDPSLNPALRKPAVSPWYDPYGVLDAPFLDSSLRKRDDVAGGGSGNK